MRKYARVILLGIFLVLLLPNLAMAQEEKATIGGKVYLEGDGSGIAGVKVYLKQNGSIIATTTSSEWNFRFYNVTPGKYTVTTDEVPGMERTTAASRNVTVAAGDEKVNINFGFAPPVGDRIRAPNFGSCVGKTPGTGWSTNVGVNHVPGGPDVRGTDDVYDLGNGNALQCACPTGGGWGWETKWWKVEETGSTPKGWNLFTQNWNLPADPPYLYRNSRYWCGPDQPKDPPPSGEDKRACLLYGLYIDINNAQDQWGNPGNRFLTLKQSEGGIEANYIDPGEHQIRMSDGRVIYYTMHEDRSCTWADAPVSVPVSQPPPAPVYQCKEPVLGTKDGDIRVILAGAHSVSKFQLTNVGDILDYSFDPYDSGNYAYLRPLEAEGEYGLYLANMSKPVADNANLIPLATGRIASPSLMGILLAYTKTDNQGETSVEIFVLGRGVVETIPNAADPLWHPSGNTLAFWRDDEIWGYNFESGLEYMFTNNLSATRVSNWTPKGIAITGIRDGKEVIVFVRTEKSGQLAPENGRETVIQTGKTHSQAVVSRDGELIVWVGEWINNDGITQLDIFAYNLELDLGIEKLTDTLEDETSVTLHCKNDVFYELELPDGNPQVELIYYYPNRLPQLPSGKWPDHEWTQALAHYD